MNHTSANPKKIKCTCKHEFQDSNYGQGVRLHNPCKLAGGETGYRCTVCRKVAGK